MNYRHSFEVRAPQDAVAAFHQDPRSMGAITPPPVIVRLHSAPPQLDEGAQMDFTLWVGPLPIRWLAQIEQVTPISPDRTLVIDHVEAELSRHWFWRLAGLGMWLSLPLLFAYRGWQTRRLAADLENRLSG
jgi:ligand-binding SRPBCC domain-containing protein